MTLRPAPASDAVLNAQDRSPPTQSPLKLMIVDDSPIARAVLSRMIMSQPGFEIVATAANASDALDALGSIDVDIVLLDVEMPGTSGLEALPEIIKRGKGARVIIVSSLAEDGAEASLKALALGAADTIPKPGASNFGGRFAQVLGERLRRIGRAERKAPAIGAPVPPVPSAPIHLRAMADYPLGCLALCASTGGLHALTEFLCALTPKVGAPILITQHLPVAFMSFFARQIATASGRVTTVAVDDHRLKPEEILIAPGDAHLELYRHGAHVSVKLTRTPASSGCMPSADPMLWSVSETFGKSGVGVIFSGMGRDGLVGSARLVDRGGAVMVQNEATSAVWGMPRAVAEAGLASAMLSPADLARRIMARTQDGSWK